MQGCCEYAALLGEERKKIAGEGGHADGAVSPLINLETQHDGRSAQVWMKRVFLLFVVVMGGQKGFAREHQNGFYET